MKLEKDATEFRNNMRQMLIKLKFEEKMATNLEKGIFNYTCRISKQQKIVRKWENEHFIRIYTDKFRSIWKNLANKKFYNAIKKKKNKGKKCRIYDTSRNKSKNLEKFDRDKIKKR